MRSASAKRRVLVIDDETQVLETVCEALALEGYDVTPASDGAAGLALIPTVRPHVIVFDLWMPVMDGWEFRHAQKAAHPEIPVVVLSALNPRDPKVQDLAADALVAKPFDLDDLYSAVARVIRTP